MIPAFRSLDWSSDAGEPLPGVWSTLVDGGIRFRRGELAIIAGPPGGGKSTLALQYAVLAKVPCLYVSCDMGRHMSAVKISSILTGKPNWAIREMRREELREHITSGAAHLWLSHESAPTLQDVDDLVQAQIEVRGTPPAALIVDNLKDLVISGSSSRWEKDQQAADLLKQMAGRYETAVIALAHTRVGRKPGYPAGMDELKGQVSEDPALILTVAASPDTGLLRLAAVKNRHGMPSPDAEKYHELAFDAPSGVLSDRPKFTPAPSWGGYVPLYEKDD